MDMLSRLSVVRPEWLAMRMRGCGWAMEFPLLCPVEKLRKCLQVWRQSGAWVVMKGEA